jgi:hypothetical protein
MARRVALASRILGFADAVASWILGGADKDLLRALQTAPHRVVDLNSLLKTDDLSRQERMLRVLTLAIEDLDRIEWAYELCGPSTGVMPDSGRPDRYVEGSGWVKSRRLSRPVDANSNPLPWISFPAIEFLTPRVRAGWRVFEYGCGYSTLWWERLGCSVIACEHNPTWAEEVRNMTRSANIIVRDLANGYVIEALSHGLFDVVVIDGRQRVACSEVAPQVVKPSGVIIWDNADRIEYRDGQQKLQAAGWKPIEFVGMSSGNVYGASTTIYYRSDNCLEI